MMDKIDLIFIMEVSLNIYGKSHFEYFLKNGMKNIKECVQLVSTFLVFLIEKD